MCRPECGVSLEDLLIPLPPDAHAITVATTSASLFMS